MRGAKGVSEEEEIGEPGRRMELARGVLQRVLGDRREHECTTLSGIHLVVHSPVLELWEVLAPTLLN
jgi:hypothetical protein